MGDGWINLFSVCFLLISISSVGSSSLSPYQHYKLESVCTSSSKKSIYLHNRPAIFTFNSTNRNTLQCHIELHVSDNFGFSIFTETMKLDNTQNCQRDFLQFGRDFLFITSYKSPKRCGYVEPTRRILRDDGTLMKIQYGETGLGKREYIEDEQKEMDIWLSVFPPQHGQKHKELKLIVTPFKKECKDEDYYYWKCPSTNKCIKKELFCDGQINCDGFEKEEQTEYCLRLTDTSGVEMFISIPIIILIVVFSIVALMFLIFVMKMSTSYLRGKRPGRTGSNRCDSVQERCSLRDPLTLRSSADSNSGRGLRGLQAQLNSPPTAPPMLHEAETMRTGVLPPHPPSYSEAVGSHHPMYSDNPPKYTEHPEDVPHSNAPYKDS